MHSRRAFTLIELLVVIAIIAILAVVVVLVLNPAQLLAQSRDANRVSDLATLNSAIGIYQTDISAGGLGTSSVIYTDLPSASSTCGDLGLIALPANYAYSCSGSAGYRGIGGSGWLLLDFRNISSGSPFGSLPVDPVNTTSSGLYYTYATNGLRYELTASMESQKYASIAAGDGGQYANLYEQGTATTLLPVDYSMAPGSLAPIALVSHGSNLSTPTVTANTLGADFLIVACYYYAPTSTLVTDSGGNTWHALTTYGSGTNTYGWIQFFYAYNALTGASDTFNCSPQVYEGISVDAFSGVVSTSDPLAAGSDQGGIASTGSIVPGTVTPSQAGTLLIAAYASAGSAASTSAITGGFTITDILHDGNDMDGGVAYLIATSTAANSPQWTVPGDANLAGAIAAFK